MEFLTKIAEILGAVEKAEDGTLLSDAVGIITAIETVISDFKAKVTPTPPVTTPDESQPSSEG